MANRGAAKRPRSRFERLTLNTPGSAGVILYSNQERFESYKINLTPLCPSPFHCGACPAIHSKRTGGLHIRSPGKHCPNPGVAPPPELPVEYATDHRWHSGQNAIVCRHPLSSATLTQEPQCPDAPRGEDHGQDYLYGVALAAVLTMAYR